MSVITLTTDFGTADYFVGAMKGAILTVDPRAVIVDITHEIAAHDVRSAAFVLFEAQKTFLSNTIHVAIVDPGVGSERRAILAVADNKFFVAPDNGLLEFIFQNAADLQVFYLDNAQYFRASVSATFHGRDVFAPVAGWLSKGVEFSRLGTPVTDFVRLQIKQPQPIADRTIETEILHIDRFGNCLVNLKRDDLPANLNENFSLEVNERKITKLQSYFAEAANGEMFMIFGSAGLLEIVAYQASAANLLEIKVGDKVLIRK